jgi:hypothetical protein
MFGSKWQFENIGKSSFEKKKDNLKKMGSFYSTPLRTNLGVLTKGFTLFPNIFFLDGLNCLAQRICFKTFLIFFYFYFYLKHGSKCSNSPVLKDKKLIWYSK